MPCTGRTARCGPLVAPSVPNVLPAIFGTLGSILGIATTAYTVYSGVTGALGAIKVVEGLILWFAQGALGPTVTISSVVAGAATAFVAAVVVVIVIGVHISDRCLHHPGGVPVCIAGVVIGTVHSFNSPSDEVFPFTATHDRVDVVVKERFFDIIEYQGANVFCTDTAVFDRRRSEIMRCYYFSEETCNAARGSLYGAVGGGVAAIVAGAIIAAVWACLYPITCLIMLVVVAIVALVLILTGALVGGQAGRAASHDTSPESDAGQVLSEGCYVTVQGEMFKRSYDEEANVIWWETSTQCHGSSTVTARPFNHCEIEADSFEMDGCPL